MSQQLKEWLQGARKRYLEAKNLIDNESLKDPPNEPYKSKYKGKEIIERLLDEIKEFESNTENDSSKKNWISLLKSLLFYEVGSVGADTSELNSAEIHLEKSLEILNNEFTDDLSVILFNIVALNQLGYIWCGRGDFEKACQLLTNSESLYHKWNKTDESLVTLDFLDAFMVDPLHDERLEKSNAIKNLEKAHTLTLYLLAQSYERCGESAKSAVYCHATLKRQYHGIENKQQIYDVIDWALNAATLSQYFAIKGDFNAARHHIACAKKVLATYHGKEEERLNKSTADLNRIFVKYSLLLLECSYEASKREQQLPAPDDTFRPYLLNEPEVKKIESQIRTYPILTFDVARQVFKSAVKHLEEAKIYYNLNEHASDYVECVKDDSKLFQNLTLYETDYDRQCKMHKRRIDMLENVLKEINPEYFLVEVRQILFELGEIYSQNAEIKTRLLEKKSDIEALKSIKKINTLIAKAIDYFSKFIRTFHDKKTNSIPNKLSDEFVRPVLLGYFSLGRLHSKIIASDPRDQFKNWSECEANYNKVLDYLKVNPQQKLVFSEEVPLIEEMLKMIPEKKKIILSSVLY